MTAFRIRKMDMSDVEFVHQQEMDIFEKSLSKKTLYDEILYNKLAHYFIALKDNQRVGYVGCWITQPNAEIMNFLVIKSMRREKIGTKLMAFIIDLCSKEQVEALTLEVRKSNLQAIRFYESFGFKQEATRKKYYLNGEDALLMVKKIGGKA
ncbi:MAG: ribosomal protein S18-alanine N-acetyltransferase [Candidatus Izemoplasmataceae bacterium]|jgi:[ribosomal protein S18]-alanine N-acetyltransferase|uniref:ribosomal protein S18-alanine N-acetyltransferase n=1 Tax=Liberiplasma polymorphum TaxID=3374570 RepID=UPI0037750FF5